MLSLVSICTAATNTIDLLPLLRSAIVLTASRPTMDPISISIILFCYDPASLRESI